jgi:hypothetical protein
MSNPNNDPFTQPRGRGKSPYWLRKATPKQLAKHRRLIESAESGARATRKPKRETKK